MIISYPVQCILNLFAAGLFLAFSFVPVGSYAPSQVHRRWYIHNPGLMWLAVAFLIWSISSMFLGKQWLPGESRIFFSTANSICFLLAIAYFDYGPDRIKVLQVSRSSRIILLLIGGLITSVELALYYYQLSRGDVIPDEWIYLPDFLLSLFTLGILAYSLFQSFYNRGLRLIAFLSSLVIVLTLIAQVIRIPAYGHEILAGLATGLGGGTAVQLAANIEILYQVALLGIFLALYGSWLIQKIGFPETQTLYVRFKRNTGNATRKFCAELLLPGLYDQVVAHPMTRTAFRNLLILAHHRISDAEQADDRQGFRHISELYPLIGNNNPAHLNISRIREALSIPKEQHGILIENGSGGRYRLRISPDKIEIDADVLEHPDFQEVVASV